MSGTGESIAELKKFMTPSVWMVKPNVTLYETCRLMREHRSSYLVIEDHGKPVGILLEEDIVRRAVPENFDLKTTLAREIMCTPAPTIESHRTMEDVNSLMKIRGCRVLVIVEDDKIVGAITLLGLLWCLESRGKRF